MLSILATSTAVQVPDAGSTGILVGLGVLTIGIAARLIKNWKR